MMGKTYKNDMKAIADEERVVDKECMESLVEELNIYSNEYYVLDQPSVSDAIFDKKYDDLIAMESKLGVVLPNSPTLKVGGGVLDGFEKVVHKNPLWSLDKCQSKEDLKKWYDDMVAFNNRGGYGKLEFVVSKKYDGLSMTSEYQDSMLKVSATRGGGEVGESITKQSMTIINLPLQIGTDEHMTVHGEAMMSKKAFEEYNKHNPHNQLKNLRNGASGTLRNLDLNECSKRKLHSVFYDIKDIGFDFTHYEDVLNYLENRGFPTTKYSICESFESIMSQIDIIDGNKNNLEFAIDGVVVRVNNVSMCEDLGYTSKFPRFAMAYKFEAEETTTILRDIVYQTSRSGRINPVGLVDEVHIDGSDIKRVTLNNMGDINRKGLKLNAEVVIRKSNDVIPEILGVVENSLHWDNVEAIKSPQNCPNCHSELVVDGAYLRCTNTSGCKPQLIKAIQHYCQRSAMNIEGLSEKTIETFVDNELLNGLEDIYSLYDSYHELIKLEGFGVKSIDKLIKSINKSQDCKLHQLIFGLGIAQVGLNTSKKIAEICKTVDGFMLVDIDDIREIGSVASNNVYDWVSISDNKDMVFKIASSLNIEEFEEVEIQESIFTDKAVVITGSFDNYKRSDIKSILEEHGAKVRGSVSGKTDIVVYGDKAGSKLDKATELDIKTMNEKDFDNNIK